MECQCRVCNLSSRLKEQGKEDEFIEFYNSLGLNLEADYQTAKENYDKHFKQDIVDEVYKDWSRRAKQ